MSTSVDMANNRLCEGFMLSLQLGMAICYQSESTYFPASYLAECNANTNHDYLTVMITVPDYNANRFLNIMLTAIMITCL